MSAMIPREVIDDIQQRMDIVDVVSRVVELKKKGRNHLGLCPFHKEKTPSFTVSADKQFYHCFGCGAHGTVLNFVMETQNLNFVEAVKQLAQEVGVHLPAGNDPVVSQHELAQEQLLIQQQLSVQNDLQVAQDYYQQQLKQSAIAIHYLQSRGVLGKTAKRFQLGYAPPDWQNLKAVFPDYERKESLLLSGLIKSSESHQNGRTTNYYDFMRDRIVFPIHNVKGTVIGFGGRVMNDDVPKYLNSPQTIVFDKKMELYGLSLAVAEIRHLGWSLMVEGYMDVVMLHQAGLNNAVATLGTACGEEHLKKLWQYGEQIVVAFDGDRAGQEAAKRIIELALPWVTEKRRISFLYLPPQHDPDSYVRQYGKNGFLQLVETAAPFSKFLIEMICQSLDLLTPEGRALAWSRSKPLLKKMQSSEYKNQLEQHIKRIAQVSPRQVGVTQSDKTKWANRPISRQVVGNRHPKISPPRLEERWLVYWVWMPQLWLRIPPEKRRRFCQLVTKSSNVWPVLSAMVNVTMKIESHMNLSNDYVEAIIQHIKQSDELQVWWKDKRTQTLQKQMEDLVLEVNRESEFNDLFEKIYNNYQKFFA